MRVSILAVALVACGPPADDVIDAGADGPTADARPDAPPGCERPPLDAPGLQGYVTNAVALLAATPRATATQRDAARTKLATELSALGWTPQMHSYAGGINVHASIPATMGNGPRIVVGAHFDTVAGSPGANDNASGAAVVLAIARYLADTPCRTAPVTIAFFDQEETGLFGSRAFAQTLTPVMVRAVHTIDQVAWDADGDRVFELELPTATLEQEWRAAAAIVGATISVTTTTGTDHESFRNRGFAAMGLTEEYVGGDTSPHRHLASDTAATVDAAYLVLAAKLTAQVILDEVSP